MSYLIVLTETSNSKARFAILSYLRLLSTRSIACLRSEAVTYLTSLPLTSTLSHLKVQVFCTFKKLFQKNSNFFLNKKALAKQFFLFWKNCSPRLFFLSSLLHFCAIRTLIYKEGTSDLPVLYFSTTLIFLTNDIIDMLN